MFPPGAEASNYTIIFIRPPGRPPTWDKIVILDNVAGPWSSPYLGKKTCCLMWQATKSSPCLGQERHLNNVAGPLVVPLPETRKTF
jgi:hypothetical protein